MAKLFLDFYNALGSHEKKVFWFGSIVSIIGFIMIIDVLKPPAWFGWQETKGDIIGMQGKRGGIFSGGSTTFVIRYDTYDGKTLTGVFKISPLVLNAMTDLKIFYKTNNPSVFYVHNSSKLVIALTSLIFGLVVILSFFLYYKDKQKGIDYD